MTTVKPPQGAPAAIALLGAAGTIERATAQFLESYAGDEHLIPHLRDVERIVEGQSDRLTITLADLDAELSAVVAPDGRRYALLTVSAGPEVADDRPHPLLAEPLDGSPAVVWIKDLDGRYLRVNSAYAEQLQTDPREVCGRTDGELSPNESIDALRLRENDLVGEEPLELEYTVPAYDGRPAFAVVRFALRDPDGEPVATCAVGSALASARLARSESERLMKIARSGGLSEAISRERLLAEWGLERATGPAAPSAEPPSAPVASDPSENGDLAAVVAERDAALSERDNERSRAELAETRNADELAAERQLVETLRTELITVRDELERAHRATAELPSGKELEAERGRADQAEAERERAYTEAAQITAALDAERANVDGLRAELTEAREELERTRGAAAELPSTEQLDEQRSRAEQAQSDSEQAHVEAAATAAALDRERSIVDGLRGELDVAHGELTAARGELTAVRGELKHAQRTAAERPSHEELDCERSRAAEAEAAREQAREEAAQGAAALNAERETLEALRAELLEARQELEAAQRVATDRPSDADLERERLRAEQAEAATEQARVELAAITAALDGEHATVQSMRDELAAVTEELERARKSAEAPDAAARDDLDRERERADRAEAALAEQRARTEEALASAEQATREAAASAMEADAEHRAAEALGTELSAALDQLARSHQAGEEVQPSALDAPPATGPAWDAASQRALSAALAGISEWRDVLSQAVKSIGADGGWDAAIAWCPDQRRGTMKCAAMWTPDGSTLGAFETRIWQHRQHVSAAEFADAQESAEPKLLIDLASAEDTMLRNAAAEGMGSALLLPIRNGLDTVGMLELLSRTVTLPDTGVLVALEGVSLQLGAIAQLLNFAAAPHWHLDRM